MPNPRFPPPGCRYHPRCAVGPLAQPGREACLQRDPHQDDGRAASLNGGPVTGPGAGAGGGRFAACHFPLGAP